MYIRQLTDSVRSDRESYIREHKGEKTQLINRSNKNNTTPCCICKSQLSLSEKHKSMQRASPDYRKWVLLMETTMEQHQVLKSDQWELTELRLPRWQVTRIKTGGGQQQVTAPKMQHRAWPEGQRWTLLRPAEAPQSMHGINGHTRFPWALFVPVVAYGIILKAAPCCARCPQ